MICTLHLQQAVRLLQVYEAGFTLTRIVRANFTRTVRAYKYEDRRTQSRSTTKRWSRM